MFGSSSCRWTPLERKAVDFSLEHKSLSWILKNNYEPSILLFIAQPCHELILLCYSGNTSLIVSNTLSFFPPRTCFFWGLHTFLNLWQRIRVDCNETNLKGSCFTHYPNPRGAGKTLVGNMNECCSQGHRHSAELRLESHGARHAEMHPQSPADVKVSMESILCHRLSLDVCVLQAENRLSFCWDKFNHDR